MGRKAHDFTNDGRWNVTPEAATNGFFLHNHWNIEIHYKQIKDEYFILKTTIEPFSIEQFNSSTGSANLASCRRDLNETEQQQHTRFEKLTTVPLQPLSFGSIVHFTYDVTWIRDDTTRHSKRWDPVLSSGQTYGVRSVEFGGVVLGAFILASLVGALTTWILRDFSYKPIAVNSEIVEGDFTDEEATELNMWPLSKWIFFPPRHAPILFCILCGTGAHLLLASLCFLVLFRLGIISQSQGANLLTPATITYTMSAIVGGYVTARLYAIFHGTRNVALASSLITAIAYPLLGLLVSFLVYDVLPGAQSPLYNLTSNSTPLILIWLFWMWPWTVLGGLFGHRAGPITDFPVSAGSSGYQDLDLPDDKETITGPDVVRPRSILARYTRKCRIAILLATGGLLPVLSCFISFSYGIAGPILRGFYVSTSFGIISYTIFVSISASLAVLLYYRQIRTNRYEWWWAAFATAGSAGIYIFLLSMSYILVHLSSSIGSNVSGASVAIYILWFGYLALGVLLINGFAGVLTCVMFNKVMYKYIMSRQ